MDGSTEGVSLLLRPRVSPSLVMGFSELELLAVNGAGRGRGAVVEGTVTVGTPGLVAWAPNRRCHYAVRRHCSVLYCTYIPTLRSAWTGQAEHAAQSRNGRNGRAGPIRFKLPPLCSFLSH